MNGEGRGFTCAPEERDSDNLYIWVCKREVGVRRVRKMISHHEYGNTREGLTKTIIASNAKIDWRQTGIPASTGTGREHRQTQVGEAQGL